MADVKITALTAVAGAASTMLIPVVEDPSGTPVTKKMTVSQLFRLDSGVITSSAPLIDMAQTWNSGGVTFTALKVNIAATASASASLLFDLQVGGSSKFAVRVDGALLNTPGITLANGQTWGTHLSLNSSTLLAWNADTYLARDAANTLAQRNGTAAQAFRIYNTYTDASNYERGVFDWGTTSSVLTIGTQKAGTGSARGLDIVIGGTAAASFDSSGNVNFYAGVYQATGLQIGAATPLTWIGRSVIYSLADGNLTLYNNANSSFGLLQIGGITSSFPAIKRVSAGIKFVVADDSASAAVEALSYTSGTPSGGTAAAWKFGSLVTAAVTPDTTRYIELDVAGTLYKVIVST